MITFLIALAGSVLTCFVLVRYAHVHLLYTADLPGGQPQKFHTTPVARIGGLGVLVGILLSAALTRPAAGATSAFWLVLLSLLPAFWGGFAEDITRRISPTTRLLLTFMTAGLASWLTGVEFVRSHVDWLDAAFTFAPFAFVCFLLAVAGLAHAMNLVDGYNGLSAGTGAIALIAMGAIAVRAGDPLVSALCFTTAGALVGFLCLNYPFGRIFLGDGGAYLQGCAIAIAAALLVQRNPQVSPWFPFALLAYPIWETLFSIWRRTFLHGDPIGAADARHLHSLVYRRLARRWVVQRNETGQMLRSAMTTLPFWLGSLIMALLAVAWYDSTQVLQMQTVVFIAGYCLIYLQVSRLKRPLSQAARTYLRRRALRRGKTTTANILK